MTNIEVCILNRFSEEIPIMNGIIQLKYKSIHLESLIVPRNNIHTYNFIYSERKTESTASFMVLHGSGRSSIGLLCSLQLPDWFNFLYSILGNEVLM